MTVPSHLDYVVRGRVFRADPTGVSYDGAHVPVEEVTHWKLHVNKVTQNFVRRWWAKFEVVGTNATLRATLEYKLGKPTEFDTMITDVVNYSAGYLSPRVALRYVNSALQGETVQLHELAVSRDGILRKEGKALRKKHEVLYPWSAYLGCQSVDKPLLRTGDETKWVRCGPSGSGVGQIDFDDHGIVPMVLDTLAQHFRS